MGGDSLRVGTILLSKYTLESVLGEGGMGVVVSARHLSLNERVAIKFLLPAAVENPEVVARFLQEARAAVRIRSEHVARVFDVGNLETGEPYMVMEHLEGSDLSHLLQTRGPLPVEQTVDCIIQACVALAEAHRLGIIHRDLKPANLFLTTRADGSPLIKVLDFGISKATLLGPDAVSLTQTSVAMGTPYYMSPEQLRSARSVDVRSDIWSLGITMFELLAGRAPFMGETLAELCVAVLTNETPRLREVRPDVPPELEAIVQRCLEKSPERRYQNMGELALALSEFGSASSRLLARRSASLSGAPRESLPPDLLSPGPSSPTVVSQNQAPPVRANQARDVGLVSDATILAPTSAPKRPVWPLALAVSVVGAGVLGWSLRSPPPAPAAVAPAVSASEARGAPSAQPLVPPEPEPKASASPAVSTAAVVAMAVPTSKPAGSVRRAASATTATASPPAPSPAKTPATSAHKDPEIGY